MGYYDDGPLRISPNYNCEQWGHLREDSEADWRRAVDIVQDRLDGRFLKFARRCLEDENSGFTVLAIDCLLIEALQQFREGCTDGTRRSRALVTTYLTGSKFQPDFDEEARTKFYEDIRCGLLHQAEAKNMWLVRRNQSTMLRKVSSDDREGYTLDVRRFHKALEASFCDYLIELVQPEHHSLRTNLWIKMNHLSGVRTERAGLFG